MQQQKCGLIQAGRNAVQAIPKHAIIILKIYNIRKIIVWISCSGGSYAGTGEQQQPLFHARFVPLLLYFGI